MKTKILLTIIATAILVSSCISNNEKNNPPLITQTSENNQHPSTPVQPRESENNSTKLNFSLDDLKGIPEEIDGCACYFSENDEKFKNRNYLFAANFDSIAFVSIDNKLTRLKLISTGREPNTFGDNDHIDVYNSDLYKITVDIKYKKSSGDETWRNDGTITIEGKNGEKVVEYFVGECGC